MKEITLGKFRLMCEAELARIPQDLRDLLLNVTIEAKDEPGLEAEDMEDGPDLLGLYDGATREEMLGSDAHGVLPAKVYLYRLNLLDCVESVEGLQKEIRLTLRHELAHHFGFDDEELERVWPEGA